LNPVCPLASQPTANTQKQLSLVPGDGFTFLSDGVVETQNTQCELFGFDRTQGVSAQSAHEIAGAAQAFGQQDDINVLALTIAGAEVLHARAQRGEFVRCGGAPGYGRERARTNKSSVLGLTTEAHRRPVLR
jgi:hypothetical protein